MKQFDTIIKELETYSLYQFKCFNDECYSLKVLYFSADDYHRYVGFENNADIVICSVGSFYVDKKNNTLFFDNPELEFEVSKHNFKKYYHICKDLTLWNNYILNSLYPKSKISEKN